jgi:diacylglycerol kinase (ATP)
VPLGATYALQDPARLPETVQQAVADDHDLVILGCGDGWVSSVVDLFVSRR